MRVTYTARAKLRSFAFDLCCLFFLPEIEYKMGVLRPVGNILLSLGNQKMHKNDHFIVMLSQTLLHVSVYQRHYQGAHMIVTSYLYVGVHYGKNNGIPSEVASISIVTLWI
jgi:hypothetical protein